MLKLRRVIKATTNFEYLIECVEFLPKGRVKVYVVDVNCSHTEMRRLVEDTHYEVFVGNEFLQCSKTDYEDYISTHKRTNVILRKKKMAHE